MTGETAFLGWNGFLAGVSGDKTDPFTIRFAYGWTSECLGPFVRMSTGVGTECHATQYRLFRTDLVTGVVTGVVDLVALTAGRAPSIAISPDGSRLAAVASRGARCT